MMSVSRYPLAWPEGWPRTKSRRSAAFKVHFDKAVTELGYEIERLRGRYPILSSNVELRIDGQMRRDKLAVADPGVAVYFELKGGQKVFACDTYHAVRDNIRAIGMTIAALRTLERHGASQMLDRALSAFTALPPKKSCWEVLGIAPGSSRPAIQAAYKNKALILHPDQGGPQGAMAELNIARDEALLLSS
jgi:hypothetical protein